MEAYTDFATVYDTFMDETPYDVWGTFVAGLIEKYSVSKPAGSTVHMDSDAVSLTIDNNETGTDMEAALEQERNHGKLYPDP